MKMKTVVLLAMALGCGLVAMLGVQQILSGEQVPQDTVPVLIAKQEIPPGVFIDPSQVVFEQRARETVPEGAVTEAAQYDQRALKVRAYPGDIILQAKLGEKGVSGASASIPKGMRLFTIPVNMTSVHSGMIRPGDRVDVLMTFKGALTPGQPQLTKAKTVLEFIEVFAIDRIREGEGGGDSSKGTKIDNLTLLVTPEQADVLMVAKGMGGELHMALRNAEDDGKGKDRVLDSRMFEDLKALTGVEKDPPKEVVKAAEPDKPKSTDFKAFLNKQEPASLPAPPPPPEVWVMEIYEGETLRLEEIKLPEAGKRLANPDTALPPVKPAVNRSETDVEAG
jgi:pilus assembly protein CpaB